MEYIRATDVELIRGPSLTDLAMQELLQELVRGAMRES
jgi:hypothetical protein